MNFQLTKERDNRISVMSAIYTVITCLVILLICLVWRWTNTLPTEMSTPPAVEDGGVEVNFGNSDQGMGDIAPEVPGDPAPEETEENQASEPTASAPEKNDQEEAPTYKEVQPNDDNNAPSIKTSTHPKPNKVVVKPVENTKAVAKKVAITPVASTVKTHTVSKNATDGTHHVAAAKAIYRGGHGTGGNGGDSYNGVSNQGIAGGHGDQGKMSGTLTSDSYTGTGAGTGGNGSGKGNAGASISEGLSGRRFMHIPSFRDKFNQDARVAVKVVVNANGQVTSASINPRGTTTTDSNIRNIALRRARQLKFNASNSDAQSGTIMFNFKVSNH